MSIGSGRINRFRLTGLASGLDTQSIVDGLMQVEKNKYNSIYRKKTTSEWKLEAYQKLNSDLSTFTNKYMSVLSKDNIMSASAYTSYKANYTANSAFTVSGTSGVIPGNYNVSQVSMARYATISGSDNNSKRTEATGKGMAEYLKAEVTSDVMKTTSGGAVDGNTKLEDIAGFGFSADKTEIKFTVNGKSVLLKNTDDINTAVERINEATKDETNKVTASFDGGKLTLSGKYVNLSNVDGTAFGENGGFAGIKEGAQARSLGFNSSTTLNDIKAAGGPDLLGGAASGSFTINGETFNYDGNSTLESIMNQVNSSSAGVRMSFNEQTGEMRIRSTSEGQTLNIENTSGALFAENTTGIKPQTVTKGTSISISDTIAQLADKMGITLTGDKFAFKVNGKEFSFDKNTSVSEMINKVNSGGANVKMHYSELTDSFGFTSTITGSSAKVSIENVSGSTAAVGANSLFNIDASKASATGQDASITINGETITKASNSFTIDGMKFDITGNYQATGSDTGYAVTFTQDNSAVVDKVKAFINDYNKLIEDLYNKTREKKYYDYYPLTDDEKDALDNDDDVAKWTDKAKSGLLRSDSVITGLLSELRNAAYSIVGDTGMMAAEIGITTSGKEGMLKLDEEKFKKALADNPDKVAEIMAGRSTATDKSQQYAESGFVARINITMNNYRQSIRANQIQQQTQRIFDYENQIKDIESKLMTKEEALWAKYSSLETLLTNMNSQSDWLSSQLAYM